jgi:hypothetical protein
MTSFWLLELMVVLVDWQIVNPRPRGLERAKNGGSALKELDEDVELWLLIV